MRYRKRITSLLAASLLIFTVAICSSAEITPRDDEEMPNYGDDSYYDDSSDGYSEDSSYYDDSDNDNSSDDYTDNGDSSEDSYGDGSSQDYGDSSASSQAEYGSSQDGESSQDGTFSQDESSSQAVAGAIGESSGTSSTPVVSEPEEEYVVIGKIEEKSNEISDFMVMAGIILIVAGAVGIVSIIAWSAAARRAAKTPDEEVYEVVGMADARNRAETRFTDAGIYEEAPERPAPPPQPEVPQPEVRRQAPRQQEPLQQVPRQQAAPQQRPVQRPAPRRTYDTEEIIREALRDKEE